MSTVYWESDQVKISDSIVHLFEEYGCPIPKLLRIGDKDSNTLIYEFEGGLELTEHPAWMEKENIKRIEIYIDPGPKLIETTIGDDTQRTFVLAPGITVDMLSEEEKKTLSRTEEYEKEHKRKENERLLEIAQKDFEKLRDIDGVPLSALNIIKRWTYRDEDDDEDEY